jgi:hypothetical protein
MAQIYQNSFFLSMLISLTLTKLSNWISSFRFIIKITSNLFKYLEEIKLIRFNLFAKIVIMQFIKKTLKSIDKIRKNMNLHLEKVFKNNESLSVKNIRKMYWLVYFLSFI